ncbi:hypothetical protein TCDM_02540 [Trypanosoma cruzi Dm28c]|uniref:Uncharacterized protein n=1 Tax=Trypanosoma cruzi Dm28c TaxID=1416333 RepID=V5BLI0_TRYCR|nr:hypothetical protein TCDM_02540 [Trypanosoma cruzi Dm28c]
MHDHYPLLPFHRCLPPESSKEKEQLLEKESYGAKKKKRKKQKKKGKMNSEKKKKQRREKKKKPAKNKKNQNKRQEKKMERGGQHFYADVINSILLALSPVFFSFSLCVCVCACVFYCIYMRGLSAHEGKWFCFSCGPSFLFFFFPFFGCLLFDKEAKESVC